MNVWETKKWQDYYKCRSHKTGLRVRYEKNVDFEVKRALNDLVCWLRTKYEFPVRVRIYVKSSARLKAKNGEMVCGTFFRPADRNVEPYIRVSTGDYFDLLKKRGKDDALASIIWTTLHELTHYFQWLNDFKLTLIGEERQATIYATKILSEYAETREHP